MGERIIILLSFILCLIGDRDLLAQDSTYTNPVGEFEQYGDVADPSVLKYDGKYYLYATSWASHTYGYKVWESTDLVHWVDKGDAFNRNLPGNGWGQENFWAPEVLHYNGYFYMVYSARASDGKLKIALAKSSDPLGPFTNVKAPLLDDDLACIDGHIFIDYDNTPYLFYVKDCSEHIVNGRHTSEVYVQKLNLNYYMISGEEYLASTPRQQWEIQSGDWRWNEGPHVIKHNDFYYLMYSGNAFNMIEYSVGYSTASDPLGPYTKYENNPILKANLDIGVSGPGHNCVTTSPDGSEIFIVYHAHKDPDNPNGGRTINIDRMCFDEEGNLYVNGPTRSPQPMPSANYLGIKTKKEIIPKGIKINQIFPNPFNGSTNIKYEVQRESFVTIQILDSMGKFIELLQKDKLMPGKYETSWNGINNNSGNVCSGVYFCRVCTDEQISTRKIIYLK